MIPAPDDSDLPSLDDATATMSVDALVAEDDLMPPFTDSYIGGSRSSTPSIPPGFGPPPNLPPGLLIGMQLPHGHPPPTREEASPKPTSRIVPTSAPFTPSRSSSFIPRAATPLTNVSVPETVSPNVTPEKPVSQTKQDIKALATNSGLSKTISLQSSQPLQSEDFPPLETGEARAPAPATPSKTQPSTKSSVLVSSKKAMTTQAGSSSKATSKAEKRAGVLSIATNTKAGKTNAATESVNKPAVDATSSSEYPPLAPASTPTGTSVQSPLARNPKTLRIPPSKKSETPAPSVATPSSTTSTFAPALPASRQASRVSASRQERPGTPTSEAISDNASITSTSFSRANSPPPSRIGSAPMRNTTKSQNKRARKHQRGDLEVIAAKQEAEPEAEPIQARKKKQKKDRNIHSATGGSTPAVSRPPSPGPSDPVREDSSARAISKTEMPDPTALVNEKHSSTEGAKPSTNTKGSDTKLKGRTKIQVTPPPEATPMEAEEEFPPTEKPLPTPASTYQELLAEGRVPEPAQLALLKNPNSSSRLSIVEVDAQAAHQKLTITPEDRAALMAGSAVHKNEGTNHRIMLTANGDYVRNLTPEEEERYLKLQADIAAGVGPTAFVSTKHNASHGFTLIGGRAVPNGPPSYFPPAQGSVSTLDAVSKIQRDEALSYINQYVLPSLSTNSQLEKALNANALDAEMLRSDPSFPSWGNDPTSNDSSVRGPTQEGILGNSLEGMTAHFAVGRDGDSGRPLGNVSLLSLTESESAMQMARKEAESLEKKLLAMMKKNRKLLLGSAGH